MEYERTSIQFLVIEDNSGDFLLISEYITDIFTHAEVVHAKTFHEAENSLLEAAHFDAILLDLTLPDKSGEELITEVLKLSLNIPVIALTGYTDLLFAVRSLSWGIMDYLLKDELTSTILHKSILYSIERKKIYSQLEDSQKKYKDLFHLSPQPMWLYETETFRFLDVNEAATKQYGYTRDEFLNISVQDVEPPVEAVVLNKKEEHKKKKELFYSSTLRHQKKDGEVIFVDIQSNPMHINEMNCKLVLATDITQLIKNEKKILSANKKLKKAYKELITLDQQKADFLNLISHEIRTPLNGIMGLTNILKDELVNTELEEFAIALKSSAVRLTELSEIALLITRLKVEKSAVTHTPANLSEIILLSVSQLDAKIKEKNIVIKYKDPMADINIIGNESLLNIAVKSILTNAINYSPGNGKITVRVSIADNNIICKITDEGPGFSQKALDNLFRTFAPGEQHVDQNIGLKLSLVKLIMDAHEGQVSIRNNASKGASVSLILPQFFYDTEHSRQTAETFQ